MLGERKDRDINRGGRGGRRGRDKGQNFGQRSLNDDDEGFETITGNKRKPKKRDFDSSSEDEGKGWSRGGNRDRGGLPYRNKDGEQIRGARVERGGNRGGRGGEN